MKCIYCDVSNKKELKKNLNNYKNYIVNLSEYADHSKNESITITHFQRCKNLVNNFKKKAKKIYSNWLKYRIGKTRISLKRNSF